MDAQRQRKRQVYSQPLFGRGPGGGASLREADSPGVPFINTQAGRGGSVSRRDHNPQNKETRPTHMGAQRQRKRQAYSQPLFGRGPGEAASLREAASPGVPFINTQAGRGGSVSRRDHNLQTRKRAQLTWALNAKEKVKSIPSHSSGGSAREALLLEKRPPSHTPIS